MNDLKESFGDFEPFHRGGFEGAFQQFAPPHDGPDVPPPPPPPYGHHDHHHKHHKDHHREHKSHRKHHGHKHHDEPDHPPAPAPVPPPPADDFSIHRWFEEGSEPVAADGKVQYSKKLIITLNSYSLLFYRSLHSRW